MASNQTAQYGLNQWSLTDSVRMEDFNADNQNIERALQQVTAAIPHVQTGTYTGTGEYGAQHPNILTFDFTPKLVIINCIVEAEGAGSSDHFFMTAVQGSKQCLALYWNTSSSTVDLQWGDNSVSWYSDSSSEQGNWKNAVYHYIAIG